MQAITDTKHLTVQTLPPILVLTGEDVGQFEWLKKDILNKIGYDPSDLNYSYFDIFSSFSHASTLSCRRCIPSSTTSLEVATFTRKNPSPPLPY